MRFGSQGRRRINVRVCRVAAMPAPRYYSIATGHLCCPSCRVNHMEDPPHHCDCIFFDCLGHVPMLNRPCFLPSTVHSSSTDSTADSSNGSIRPIGKLSGKLLYLQEVDWEGTATIFASKPGTLPLRTALRYSMRCPFDEILGFRVFMLLRRGVARYRLVARCKKAVYLVQFLQFHDVVRARACSTNLRRSISPNAPDFLWCETLR